MGEFMDKLENYNILNYLVPGVIFGALLNYLIGQNIYDNIAFVALIEYYFSGLVLSRIGSLIVSPILQKTKIIKKMEYRRFVEQEKNDDKMTLLQREANQYRTYIATFLSLLMVQVYNIFTGNTEKWVSIICFIALIVLFILSYRKQSQFIVARIENKAKR